MGERCFAPSDATRFSGAPVQPSQRGGVVQPVHEPLCSILAAPAWSASLADERVTMRRGEPPWLPGQSRYAHRRSASAQPCSSPPVSSQLCPAVATPLPRSGPAQSPQWDVLEPTTLLKY